MLMTLILLLLQISSKSTVVQNFNKNDYESVKQNWAIAQSKEGYIYFGNHRTLLQYDGKNWISRDIRNFTIRSLHYDKKGEILYVGGVNEFGYFHTDSLGNYQYYSLSKNLLKNNSFKEIWKIYKIDDDIYFCSFSSIFIFNTTQKHNGNIQSIKLNSLALHSFMYQNELYIQNRTDGVKILKGEKLVDLSWGKFFAKKFIMFVKHFNGKMLIGTYQNGLYLVDDGEITVLSRKNEFLTHKINVGLVTHNKVIIGTRKNGVYIYDKDLRLVKHYNLDSGLNDNFVSNMMIDSKQDLWLSLNNGISRISLNNPFSEYRRYVNKEITIFDIKRFKEKLYLGTNEGLFVFNDKSFEFESTIIKSKIKSMIIVDDKFYIAALSGLFRLNGAEILKISNEQISLLVKSKLYKSRIYKHSARNDQLYVMNHSNNQFITKKKYPLNAFVRTITEIDSFNLLIGTVNKGLIKIENDSIYNFPHSKINNTTQTLTYSFNDEVLITPYYKILKYDKSTFKEWVKFVTPNNVSAFKQIDEKSFWLREDGKYKIVNILGNGEQKVVSKVFKVLSPFSNLVIYPDPEKEGITWFGEQGQLIRYDANVNVDVDAPFPTYVRKITLAGDSTLFGGHHPKDERLSFSIDYTTSPLRFEFAAPFYTRPEKTTYSYKLEGFDEEWSEWSSESFKDYTGLYEGDYTFRVKAKNVYETISNEDTYSFSINPPYYRTLYAYGFYIFGFSWFVYLFIRYSAHKKTLRLQELHRIEIAENKTRELELHNKIEKQEMRTRIAGDLHDEVGSNLNGIGLVSNLLLNQLTLDEKNERRLHQIKTVALESAESMRDIVWFVNPENDSFEKTLEKMQFEGHRLLDHLDLTYTVTKESEFSEPNIDIRRNVYMFFKETLQNIVKHSEATKVDIELNVTENSIHLSVHDNGIGFDINEKSMGSGLRNYNRRAERIGGKATIQSEPNKGTTIELFVEF